MNSLDNAGELVRLNVISEWEILLLVSLGAERRNELLSRFRLMLEQLRHQQHKGICDDFEKLEMCERKIQKVKESIKIIKLINSRENAGASYE
jgi:hypothetical protein